MALTPVTTDVQWLHWTYVILFGLQLLISLPWMLFIRERNRTVLLRLLGINVLISLAFIVNALMENRSVTVRERDGDHKPITYGLWLACFFIVSPLGVYRLVTLLHHGTNWRVISMILAAGIALLRFFGTIVSDETARWELFGVQVLVALALVLILIIRSGETMPYTVAMVLLAALLGSAEIVLFALGYSQTNTISYFGEQLGYLVVFFVAHFIGGFVAIHTYRNNTVDTDKVDGMMYNLLQDYGSALVRKVRTGGKKTSTRIDTEEDVIYF